MVSSSSPTGKLLRSAWHLIRLAFAQCGCSVHQHDVILFTSHYVIAMAVKRRKEDSLFGRLARVDETAGAGMILAGVHRSDWSRPVGRPCTSWMATLKGDLSLHNLTFEDAIELALDKSLWRLYTISRFRNIGQWTYITLAVSAVK